MHPETGGGYSFPSGHAPREHGLLGADCHRRSSGKAMWVAAVVGIVPPNSLSRIYLNVHWPVDIAGEASLSA